MLDNNKMATKSKRVAERIRKSCPTASRVFGQNGIDCYTGQVDLSKISIPQVDHVIELQIITHAILIADIGCLDDALMKRVAACCNCMANYNVTSRAINLKKRDVITRWLKSQRGLGDLLFDAMPEKQAAKILAAMNLRVKAVCMLLRQDGHVDMNLIAESLENLFEEL